MNWNDTKQHIRECVLADIENGNSIYQKKAHTYTRNVIIWPQGERVIIPILEFSPVGWASDDEICDYAHEFADSAEWVIYTAKARALWTDSYEIAEYEDVYGHNGGGDIDSQITTCVYLATRDAVHEAVQSIRDEMEPAPWNGYCDHGVYVGGCGADFMCVYCELGEE